MRKQSSGLRSTTRKPKSHRDAVKAFATAAAAEEKEAVAAAARAMAEDDDNEIQNPNEIQKDIMVKVYDTHDDAQLKMYTDQTGKFPTKAASGNQYIMVLVEINSGAILAEPMRNRTSGEMIKTYQALVNCLHRSGVKPK